VVAIRLQLRLARWRAGLVAAQDCRCQRLQQAGRKGRGERTARTSGQWHGPGRPAVANVEAILGAIPPDRTLHEPRKALGEGPIELPRVDIGGKQTENVSTPAGPIAPVAVRMGRRKPPQDPGSVQEIMNQGVDSHERRADFKPERPLIAGAEQHGRQRHRQDLVRNAVHVPQWSDHSLSTGREPVRSVRIDRGQLFVDPADEIGIGNVPHEQEQAVRHLVEAAVP